VGVIGCGLISQVMHLPYLAELSDRFELAAVCDLSSAVAEGCARRYGVGRVFARWEDLIAEPLDAVLIATSGDHAPIAIAAAGAGLHVLTEKPMALCAADARRMVQAAAQADVRLMVGTMKRYDPAYERLIELLPDPRDVRLVRSTTLESPVEPYVEHYSLITGGVADEVLAPLRARDEQIVADALPGADDNTRHCYRWILLDSLVHECSVLRGVLGDPSEVVSATLAPQLVSAHILFGSIACQLSWVDLPGIARYREEIAFYAPDRRLTLELPSPFLRSMPSHLIVEGGVPGTPLNWSSDEVPGYDEAFRRELIEFSECIRSGREARTSGADAVGDQVMLEMIARAHQTRGEG
jgi:predicted dehydrogenase